MGVTDRTDNKIETYCIKIVTTNSNIIYKGFDKNIVFNWIVDYIYMDVKVVGKLQNRWLECLILYTCYHIIVILVILVLIIENFYNQYNFKTRS